MGRPCLIENLRWVFPKVNSVVNGDEIDESEASIAKNKDEKSFVDLEQLQKLIL